MLTITELRKHDGEEKWHSNDLEVLPDAVKENSLLWVDAQDPSEAEVAQLKKRFAIDELDLEELNEEGRRSRIEEIEDRVSCVISFPSRDRFVSEIKTERLALVMGKSWILSVHQGYSEITCQIYKKISTHGYSALSATPSTDVLFYIFLDLVTNEFFLVSDLVHERLQNLSKEAGAQFRGRTQQSNRTFGLEIAKSRDHVLALRQSIGPLREVVGRIVRGEFAIVATNMLPRFEDLYDRTISLIDVVDTHREEISDIGNILINFQTLTTNNIVRVLTIISAIFLPLTLIAGIYGTNFERGFFMPGSNSIYGFYLMIAIMVSLAGGLLAIFRRKGWL